MTKKRDAKWKIDEDGTEASHDSAKGATMDEALTLAVLLSVGGPVIARKTPEGACNLLVMALGLVLARHGDERAGAADWNLPVRRAMKQARVFMAEYEAEKAGEKH